MESTSLHGRVQVSSATHALVESSNAGAFSWVPRLSVRGTRSCGCFRVQFVSHKKNAGAGEGKRQSRHVFRSGDAVWHAAPGGCSWAVPAFGRTRRTNVEPCARIDIGRTEHLKHPELCFEKDCKKNFDYFHYLGGRQGNPTSRNPFRKTPFRKNLRLSHSPRSCSVGLARQRHLHAPELA